MIGVKYSLLNILTIIALEIHINCNVLKWNATANKYICWNLGYEILLSQKKQLVLIKLILLYVCIYANVNLCSILDGILCI